ncbi:MAG: SAM-dependent DNA methyltransferase [Blastocatellia bacterium]|nr:SAM-dependent DNA methyltransferase [Blastocatellia bacterium]
MSNVSSQTRSEVLRPYLLGCGYRKPQLVSNIELANGRRFQVPLAAFAHHPYDSRSACIAVFDDAVDPEYAVKGSRSLGAPVVFSCLPEQVLFWKQGVAGPELQERIPLPKLPDFFKRYEHELAPEAIYRAKTWARFDTQYQLSFVDIGLMPLIEEEAGKKLAELIQRVVGQTKSSLGWREISPEQGQWLLKSNFWLLAAKILKDKDVPAFAALDLTDLDDVYDRVAKHYGSDEPVSIGSKQQQTALREVANEITRFSHLGIVSTEALAHLYENALITKATRVELGTHSTPSYLVDYIVGKLTPWIKDMPADQRNVFEPACGHGAFLLAALRLLSELEPVNSYSPSKRHQYLQHRLHGSDIDAFALEIARLSLTLADVPNKDGWDLKPANIFRGDTLTNYARKADIVLANPPFGDFKPDERRVLTEQLNPPKYVNKAAEMLGKVASAMKPGGVFGVVLPQGFLHDNNAASLREQLLKNFEISEICLLPDKIFNLSEAESAVILARRLTQPVSKTNSVLYRRVREADADFFKQSYISTQDKQVEFTAGNKSSFFVPELEEVWNYCQGYSKLDEFAEVGKGFEFRSKGSLPKGAITESDVQQEESQVKGFARLREALQTHGLPDVKWFNLDTSVIRRPGSGTLVGTPQMIWNYAPVSRGPWRLKAFLDQQGHPVTSRFLVVRSQTSDWPLEAIWGVCNSPLANAYCYAFSSKRDVLAGLMRELPIPTASSDDLLKLAKLVSDYFAAVHNVNESRLSPKEAEHLKLLHWRIDAEVLRLYNLPKQLERQILDLFTGERRRGVPFEQTEYLPKSYKEPLTLRELLAITADWDQTNERRAELIFKKVKKEISSQERQELNDLQHLASCRARLLAPLPIEELEAVKADLIRRGMWVGN